MMGSHDTAAVSEDEVNTFRILVSKDISSASRATALLYRDLATDNHLGYLEKDVMRRNDSLETFEEVLQIAKREKVST